MHEHDWQPIPLMCRRYSCACGVTSYKNDRGVYIEHKHKIERKAAVTAQRSSHGAWLIERTRKDYDGD